MTARAPGALGIIAGGGTFPRLAAQNARREGRRVVACLLEEAGARLSLREADTVETHSIGRAGGMLELLNREDVRDVLFVGKVPKTLHFASLDFDEAALSMIARLAGRGDMQIAAVLIEELESRGFRVIEQARYLPELATPEGILVGSPTPEQRSDVERGVAVARAIARLDIGQTVVVRQGAVVAVEAFEHTDAAIRRAGRLAKGDLTVVKVARPRQDPRFDVPAVGLRTLSAMKQAGAKMLAVEAGRSFLLDRAKVLRRAEEYGICIWGVKIAPH